VELPEPIQSSRCIDIARCLLDISILQLRRHIEARANIESTIGRVANATICSQHSFTYVSHFI
jgi:hypothetical protein